MVVGGVRPLLGLQVPAVLAGMYREAAVLGTDRQEVALGEHDYEGGRVGGWWHRLTTNRARIRTNMARICTNMARIAYLCIFGLISANSGPISVESVWN